MMNQDTKVAQGNDIRLTSRSEVKELVTALAQQATQNIDILSNYLDSSVFNNQDFIDAIKKFSLSNKGTKIRILIKDSDPMFQARHRMIKLIQHLSSSIEVRKISVEFSSNNKAFSLFDDKSFVYLSSADRYEGKGNFDDPRFANELKILFNEIWRRSNPDTNLQRIHI